MIATNRPCEAVGVEEINGLVRNAKWTVYKCQMVRDTKRQRARVRNANGLVVPMVVSTNESN